MFSILNNYSRSWKWSCVRQTHLLNQPKCQACGKSKDLIVHHIEPVHLNPNRELDPENLITLCKTPCHMVFGHLMDYKSWNREVKQDCDNYLAKLKKRPYHEQYSQISNSGIITCMLNFAYRLFSFWNNRS